MPTTNVGVSASRARCPLRARLGKWHKHSLVLLISLELAVALCAMYTCPNLNHRITEPWNSPGWKGPQKFIWPKFSREREPQWDCLATWLVSNWKPSVVGTIFLVRLFHWVIILPVKNFFLISRWNISWYNLYPLLLVFSMCLLVKKVPLSSFYQSSKYWNTVMRSP